MIVLRYFDIVGRAQPLRDALADAGVGFEDVRVTPLEWRQHRNDPNFGGPYRALPTLTWDDVTIAETLPIASFLARRLGPPLDDVTTARRDAVCSLAYLEVLVPMGELFWIGVLHAGADLESSFRFRVSWMIRKLELLDAQIPDPEDGWLGGANPAVADFFATEALLALEHVLGPRRHEAVGARLPSLTALAERVRARPAIAKLKRPSRFTSHPDEDAVIERLRALDLDL